MALRALLIGTEQGTALENLMKSLPIGNIFTERVNPANKPFGGYSSFITLPRTFDPVHVKSRVEDAVRTIISLQRRSDFFKSVTTKTIVGRKNSMVS